MMAVAVAAVVGQADPAVAQTTSGWNTTSGTWDTTTANWTGAGSVWVNGTTRNAVFANTATSSTVALGGGVTAGAVTIGNGGNNATYTFRAGALSAVTFTVQGNGLNEPAIVGYPTTTLTDVALSVAGDLGVGRAELVIGGSSTVTANRIGGAGLTGVTSAEWGQVTIRDGAMVTATNGVVGATTAWGLNLDGGTLMTSGIDYGPHSYAGSVVNLSFNGTLVRASQSNGNFVTVTGGLDFAPVIRSGGARLDTNGFAIGIGLPLSGTGGLTKLGAGTLTLTGASRYSGGTTIAAGTLVSGYEAPGAGAATALGTSTATNVITVEAGGILTGTANNWLDNTALAAGGANAHTVVVNQGGVLRGGVGTITGLGNTTLNGGTIAVTSGYFVPSSWNGSFVLGGDITVSGSVASAIVTDAFALSGRANIQISDGANGFGGTRTFTVNDVTGDAASDLVVSARLANGTVIKAGPGTLEVAVGVTGTATPADWRIDAGTLKTTVANVLSGGAVTSTSTAATFDLGGTRQAVYGLAAAGPGNGYRGTITNGTIDLGGRDAYLQEGTFTMNLTGTNGGIGPNGRLWIGGDPSATVYLGGTNTRVPFQQLTATFIGATSGTVGGVSEGTGPAGTVKLLSPQALGPSGRRVEVHNGSILDLNGQTGLTVSLMLLNTGHLVNSSATAASFTGGIDLAGQTSSQIGGVGDLALGGVISNGGFTKVGAGTLTLLGSSTYAGGTTIESGTVMAAVQATAGGAGALGAGTASNQITINNGGVLTGNAVNWLAGVQPIVVNPGGVLRGGVGVVATIGSTTLNGGTIEVTNGYVVPSVSNQSFTLGGNVTVSGSVASSITTAAGSGGSAAIQFRVGQNRQRTFTVNDVTGDAASDLVVRARLTDGSVIKAGIGTLELAAGATGTGTAVDWQLDAGTLKTTAANVIAGRTVVGTSTSSTFDLGRTTQTVAGLGLTGQGRGYLGTITNGTINLNGNSAYFRAGTFTMNLTGSGNSRLWIGGDASATVFLGGTNSSTYPDENSTIIGYLSGTIGTGAAGTVRLLSPQALGPLGQNTQVHNGSTLDINGQSGITVSSILLMTGNLVNMSGTAAVYGGNIDLGGQTSSQLGGSGSITLGGMIVNGGFTKVGTAKLILTGVSSYADGTTINGGGVLAGVPAEVGGSGALGLATPTNVVTINHGGSLTGTTNNWLENTALAAGGGAARALVINPGGQLRGQAGVITGLGNTTLAGGTITVTDGLTGFGWNGSFVLGGDIMVSGSVASSIATPPDAGGSANLQMSNGANGVGGTRTFTVNDVTGNAASDLIVSARLANGTIIKAGAGTLELAAGATGTATAVHWRIDGGTLATTVANAIDGAVVSSTATSSTFDLGGTTQTLGGLAASGSGNGYRGTITNGTIDLGGNDAFLREGTFTINLTGSGRVFIGGDASATVFLGGTNAMGTTTTIGVLEEGFGTGAAGTVRLLSPEALGGPAAIAQVFNNGALDLNGQNVVTVGGISLDSGRLLNSTAASIRYDGVVNLAEQTSAQIGGAGNIALGGSVTTGGFTKVGGGTLKLDGTNTYAGGTTIDGGTVLAAVASAPGQSGALGIGLPTNVVTINAGGVLTGAVNNWLDSTALAAGGGDAHAVVIHAGGLLHGRVGAITGLGTTTLRGGTIAVTAGFTGGGWNGSFVLGGDVTVSGSAASSIITAAGSGGAANLQMSDGANGVGGTRTFAVNDVTGDAASDLVVSARLASGMIIKAGAGTLELAAGATGTAVAVGWQVNAGTLKIGPSFGMSGPGLILSGGTVAAAGRTLTVDRAGGIGQFVVNSGYLAGSPALQVAGGGTVVLSGSTVATIDVSTLLVDGSAGGGRVDLGAGRINVAAGGITPEALVAAILAGRDGNPAAVWTGSAGITSSVAAAAIATGSSPRAVGWFDEGSGGLAVAFAAPGDTNIDGLLDVLDVANVLGGGQYDSGQPAVWSQGDFGYDGMVDILDVADFLGTGLFDAGSYLPAPAAAAVVAVPEPSASVAVTIACAIAAWRLARRSLPSGRRGCSLQRRRAIAVDSTIPRS